jgi:hypothetical protein
MSSGSASDSERRLAEPAGMNECRSLAPFSTTRTWYPGAASWWGRATAPAVTGDAAAAVVPAMSKLAGRATAAPRIFAARRAAVSIGPHFRNCGVRATGQSYAGRLAPARMR